MLAGQDELKLDQTPLGGAVRLAVFMAKKWRNQVIPKSFYPGEDAESWGRGCGWVLSYINCMLCVPALCYSTVNAASQGRYHPLSYTDKQSEVRGDHS